MIRNYKKNFEKNGFIIIRNFFSKKTMDSINEKLDSFIKKESSKIRNKDKLTNFVDKKVLNSFHKMDSLSYVKDIKKNKELIGIIENLFSEKIVDMGSELFAKPSRKGLASPYHQDNFYFCLNNAKAVTVWIALEKANKSNGGVEYFVGSHKGKLLSHVPSFSPGSSQKVKNLDNLKKYKKKIPNLGKGDCMIHHSMIVHGSGINKSSKSRKGLTVRFKAKSSRIDKVRQKTYWKSLKKQVIERKKI